MMVMVWLLCLLLWGPVPRGVEGLDAGRLECASSSSDLFFFPAGVFADRARTGDFDHDAGLRRWYSKPLRAMAEPSLSCKQPRGEVYRFLWLRSRARPVSVRVADRGDGATLSAVELDVYGKARRVERELSPTEWAEVVTGVGRVEFWQMRTEDDDRGLDGAQWILEGRKRSRYHVVDRWSPDSGAYRELCLSLLKLAGMLPAPRADGTSAIY